jgi:hypothetical protein
MKKEFLTQAELDAFADLPRHRQDEIMHVLIDYLDIVVSCLLERVEARRARLAEKNSAADRTGIEPQDPATVNGARGDQFTT